ncbi:MAG: hypothetical protein ACOC97_00265 [Myxococcota bacterium]
MPNPAAMSAVEARAPAQLRAQRAADSPGRPEGAASFAEVLDRARAGRAGGKDASPALDFLRESAREIARGDGILRRAMRTAHAGGVFDHGELLALQAGVYRYTQELELTGKLVDKSTQSLRHVLQSQT